MGGPPAIYTKASEKGREGRSVDSSVEKSESDQPAKRKRQKRDTAMCNPLSLLKRKKKTITQSIMNGEMGRVFCLFSFHVAQPALRSCL